MKTIVERLTAVMDHKNDPMYAGSEIESVADEVVVVGGDGLLAVSTDPDSNHIEVALFEFAQSHSDGSDPMYARVMHGYGYGEGLRELRHTYWGEDGYIFYPSRKLITEALEALREWFDLD